MNPKEQAMEKLEEAVALVSQFYHGDERLMGFKIAIHTETRDVTLTFGDVKKHHDENILNDNIH